MPIDSVTLSDGRSGRTHPDPIWLALKPSNRSGNGAQNE